MKNKPLREIFHGDGSKFLISSKRLHQILDVGRVHKSFYDFRPFSIEMSLMKGP
jgi:hypothetical protein